MRLLDSIDVIKKDRHGNKVVESAIDKNSNKKNEVKKELGQGNKKIDMGIFNLAESVLESIITSGNKTSLTVNLISKEFEDCGLSSASDPEALAREINNIFSTQKLKLRADLKNKRHIIIAKIDP